MPGLGPKASLPNRYNRLLLRLYIRNWFSFEDLLLWNSIVGDLPIKSNTFGLFSFERDTEGEWQQRAFSPTLWRHRRGWKMQSLGSENCQALSFSRLPAPTIRVRARQCLKVQADDCWQEREGGSLDMDTAMGLRELSSLAIQVFLSGNFDDKGTSHSQSTITHFRRSTQYTPRIEDIWLDIYCEFSTEMTIL